jgi:antitoxin VapB
MGDMSLNIKNERTHALVRELATLTGMSQTDAVTDAVERRLAELTRETEAERQARVDEIMRLVSLIAPGFREAWGDRDPTEDLYDDMGLPR